MAKRGSPSATPGGPDPGLRPIEQLIAGVTPLGILARGSSGEQQHTKRNSGNGGDSTSLGSLGDPDAEARAKKLSHASLTALGERDSEHTVPVDRKELERFAVQLQRQTMLVNDILTQLEQVKVLFTIVLFCTNHSKLN